MSMTKNERGFTLVELVTALGVFSVIAISILGLYTSLVSTTIIMKQKSIALSLANNHVEYLKSLPYTSLAVTGGSIYSPSPIPSTTTKTVDRFNYTVKTSINYVDNAFDGCANYPSEAIKQKYCRNYPAPSGAPNPDSNPQDYKIAHVTVYGRNNTKLAELDTQIAARVAETSTTTGALFVYVIDDNGNPVSGANARVQNTTVSPALDLNDSTDSNGLAVFYGLTPDSSGYDYVLTASKANYSTLKTIAPSGTLQPTYSNQQVLTQQSSYATLVIKPQGVNSLLIETTDTAGSPLSSVKTYIKGGYKSYTSTSNTAYYYDTISPSDTRPTTDATGLVSLSNLVPGSYIFCGDLGATNCSRSGSTLYLVAAIPYTGTNSLNPISVPTQTTIGDPGTGYVYGGSSYLQKVRLMFSGSVTFPRVMTMSPDSVSLASSPLSAFVVKLSGVNLPCSSSPASCSTVVRLTKGSTVYTGSCTGSSAGTQVSCTFNLTGVTEGILQLSVTANGQTLTLPVDPLQGGVDVKP